MTDQDLRINVVTKADTSGLDEVQAKTAGISAGITQQLAAAGAMFDPITKSYKSLATDAQAAAKETTGIGLSGIFAGAQLNKAKGEATVLARELATGSVNARTIGALLGSLGTTLTLGAISGFVLFNLIKGAIDDVRKMADEEKKATDELDKQVGKWTELAKVASSFKDVVKLQEDMTSELDKAGAAFDELQKKALTLRQTFVDSLVLAAAGMGGAKGDALNTYRPEQAALDAQKKAAKELFQTRLENDVALDDAAKKAEADWERIKAGLPSEGVAVLTQRIAALNDQLDILYAKRLPALGATPTDLQSAKAAQDAYTKINAEKVVLLKHLDDEIKAQEKLDQESTRDQRKQTNQQLNETLREQQTIIQGIRQQQQLIQGNVGLSPDEKQAALLALDVKELNALNDQVARLKQEQKNTLLDGPQMDQVNQKLQAAQFEVQLLAQHIRALTAPFTTELQNWANSYGTTFHQMATTLRETVGAAFNELNQYIVTGKFNLQGFIQQIELLGLKLLEQLAIQEVISLIGNAASVAQAKVVGPQIAAAYAGAATAVSTASWGVAPAVGTAAELASLATITSALTGAGGGYQRGGFTGYGGEGEFAGAAHRMEFVFGADAVRTLGVPFLEQLHAAAMSGRSGIEGIDIPPADMNPGDFGTQAPSRRYAEPGGYYGTPPSWSEPPMPSYIGEPTVQTFTDPFGGSSGGYIPGVSGIPPENIAWNAPPMPTDISYGDSWNTHYPQQSGYTILPGGQISAPGGGTVAGYTHGAGPLSPVGYNWFFSASRTGRPPISYHDYVASFHGFTQKGAGLGGTAGVLPVRGRHTGGLAGNEFSFLQSGEFVVRTPAVQHYGVDLMHAINEMSVPSHHAGGPIGSRGPGSAKGSEVNIFAFTDMKALVKEMGGRQGRNIIFDAVRGRSIDLGL
jgi:hypothetical protein